jgi:hypothetical protein
VKERIYAPICVRLYNTLQQCLFAASDPAACTVCTHSLVVVGVYTVMCCVAPWPEKRAGWKYCSECRVLIFQAVCSWGSIGGRRQHKGKDSMQVPVTSSRSTDAMPVCLQAWLLSACKCASLHFHANLKLLAMCTWTCPRIAC